MPSLAVVKSAERTVDLLELLARHDHGLTLTEIARQLELPKSSAHGLLHTLRGRGYVGQDETARTFRLGLRLWELGRAFDLHNFLVQLALPIMRRVGGEVNEIVQLAVRDGIQNVYLAKVDCDQPIQLISRVGARLYCHATGLGKALLSGLSDDELDRLYAGVTLPRFTASTIVDLPALKEAVRRTRAQGYAEDREEYVAGLRCVATPLRAPSGQVVAAVSLSLPTPRATAERLAHGRRLLLAGSVEFQKGWTDSAGSGLDGGTVRKSIRQEGGGDGQERAKRAMVAG